MTSARNTFQQCKFVIDDLNKYVMMDIQVRVILEDLRISFAKILGVNLFGKKLVFIANIDGKSIELDSSKNLQDQEEKIGQLAEKKEAINISIKFNEMGAQSPQPMLSRIWSFTILSYALGFSCSACIMINEILVFFLNFNSHKCFLIQTGNVFSELLHLIYQYMDDMIYMSHLQC